MEIVVVDTQIPLSEVKRLADVSYGEMVKVVADVEKQIIAIGGEYHADGEKILLERGSLQENVWGFNIYPDKDRSEWIEFYSLINIRPRQGNVSYLIELEHIKEKIVSLCKTMII